RAIVERSQAAYGAIALLAGLEEACATANDMAPAHVELMTNDDENAAAQIRATAPTIVCVNTHAAEGNYIDRPDPAFPAGRASRLLSSNYSWASRLQLKHRYSRCGPTP